MARQLPNGQWVDDNGNPVAAPGAASPLAISLAPPRAPLESTSSVESKTMSDESRGARLDTALKEGQVATANEQLAAVTAEQAAAEAEGARLKAEAMERAQKDAAARKVQEEKERGDWIAQQQTLAKQQVDAKRKAGAARADFWKGNEAGEVFVSLMRAVQEGIQSYKGGSGPTGAERIVEAKMSAHERRLVGEWEASKEAQELKQRDFEEWQRQKAQIETRAAKESSAEIDLILARAQAASKKLDPEKQKRMADLANKTEALTSARAGEAYARTFDQQKRFSSTKREGLTGTTDGASPAGKLTQGQGEAATAIANMADTVKDLMSLPPLSTATLKRYRDNSDRLEATKTKEGSGLGGQLIKEGQRALNMIPESPYDGMKDHEKAALQKWYKIVSGKLKEISGAAVQEAEFNRIAPAYMPVVGDSPAEQRRKMSDLLQELANRAVQTGGAEPAVMERVRTLSDYLKSIKDPEKGKPSTKDAVAEKLGRKSEAPKAEAKGEDDEARKWLEANPNDPRAKEIRKALGL